MKITTSSCLSLLLLLILADTAVCQTPIKARTESGKDVILSTDGTWKYVPEVSPAPSSLTSKPAGATTLFKSDVGGFGIWYDKTKWVLEPKGDERGKAQFRLKRGDAYAVVLVEELNIPTATWKEVAMENAKEASSDARIILEETRTVNKSEVLCLKIDGTLKGIAFRFYGYYYGGKQGSIQILTFTGQDLFAKYEQDLLELLNGLEVIDAK